MKSDFEWRGLGFAAMTFLAVAATGYASDITYQVNQDLGFVPRGNVTGTIETNGAIGTVAASDILAWNLVLHVSLGPCCGYDTYFLSSGPAGNSILTMTGSGLSATAGQLRFDFQAPASVEIGFPDLSVALGLSPPGSPGFEGLIAPGSFGNLSPWKFSPQPFTIGTAVTPISQPGGTSSAPVFLESTSVSQVTGTIGGFGTQDYYSFRWNGGAFSSSASVAGAPVGGSYLYSMGVGAGCNSVASATLDGSDSFSGGITFANLAPGQYCIGLDANNPNDPVYTLTFATPVGGVPEPSGLILVTTGLAVLMRVRRGRA